MATVDYRLKITDAEKAAAEAKQIVTELNAAVANDERDRRVALIDHYNKFVRQFFSWAKTKRDTWFNDIIGVWVEMKFISLLLVQFLCSFIKILAVQF